MAVIAIDDTSIANIGRWPWPRDVHAQLVDKLASAQAKVIGYTVFFSEPQVDPALPYINQLTELYGLLSPEGQEPARRVRMRCSRKRRTSSNTDRKLADSVAQGRQCRLAGLVPRGSCRSASRTRIFPTFYARMRCRCRRATVRTPVPAASLDVPVLPQLGAPAGAIGHLNSVPDVDGAIRTEPLVISYYDQYYPSLSLQIAAKSLNLGTGDIKVDSARAWRWEGSTSAPIPSCRCTPTSTGRDGRPPFTVDSFFDVYSGKIPAEKYRDKIVLIGATAAGVGSVFVTPVSTGDAPTMPAVLMPRTRSRASCRSISSCAGVGRVGVRSPRSCWSPAT